MITVRFCHAYDFVRYAYGVNTIAYLNKNAFITRSFQVRKNYCILNGNSINNNDNSRNFEMEVTVLSCILLTARSLYVVHSSAKKTKLICISVSSKRAKIQNHIADESCAVCSLPSIIGKPGKNCLKCDHWMHNGPRCVTV